MIGKTSYSENHRNKENTGLNFEPRLAKGQHLQQKGIPLPLLILFIKLIPGLHLNKSTVSPLLILFASEF